MYSWLIYCYLLICLQTIAIAASEPTLEIFIKRPRVFVLTDIANEPDDMMSLTRFLLYANHFNIQGIAATTSTWLRNETYASQIQDRLRMWGQVRENLTHHATGWPETSDLLGLISSGPPQYGMSAVGSGKDSEASLALGKKIESAPVDDPLWILVWGGANVLAQTLWKARKQSMNSSAFAKFISKIRVYAISDQDDAGPWIRTIFPDIFYIASHHAFNIYNLATWTGISGEELYGFDKGGPDSSLVTNEWLEANIRSAGNEYLATYPIYPFIMEGDTPSFLYLIQNGLSASDEPHWGSWGGRYGLMTKGDNIWVDTVDVNVPGVDDNIKFTSNHATIWRWRKAYQNDFAARIKWTTTSDFQAVNHNPILIVNGYQTPDPLYIEVSPGGSVTIDATKSFDPDGDSVTYKWWQYLDASAPQRDVDQSVPMVDIRSLNEDMKLVSLTVPSKEILHGSQYSEWVLGTGTPNRALLHVILEAWDDGAPELVSYRRVVLSVKELDVEEAVKRRRLPGEL